MPTLWKILREREDQKALTMGDEIELFAVDDEPRTVLHRLFAGPRDEVFRAWTDATILQAW